MLIFFFEDAVSKKTDGKAASTMAKRRIKSMNTVK
jgi:hypothetical protein